MSDLLPNFLIVGAAKSGTTSLYYQLDKHPEVFMSPVKEPLFFCSAGVDREVLEKELYPVPVDSVVTDFDAYARLFAGSGKARARGEASVYYLADYEKTITNIKRLLPDWRNLKIVIILRNPTDACFSKYLMYSQYLKHFRNEKHILTFEQSLAAEEEMLARGNRALAPLHWFRYHEQIKAYLDNFSDVRIYLFEQLKHEPQALMSDLFEFLGVRSDFVSDLASEKYNASGIPRNSLLYRFLIQDSPLRRVLRGVLRSLLGREQRQRIVNLIFRSNMQKPVMSDETRRLLQNYYREDIVAVQGLINRDLEQWLGEGQQGAGATQGGGVELRSG